MPTDVLRPTFQEIRAGVVLNPLDSFDGDPGDWATFQFGAAPNQAQQFLGTFPTPAHAAAPRLSVVLSVTGRWDVLNPDCSLAVYFRPSGAHPWTLLDRQQAPEVWPGEPAAPGARAFDVSALAGEFPAEGFEILVSADNFDPGGDPPAPPFPEG